MNRLIQIQELIRVNPQPQQGAVNEKETAKVRSLSNRYSHQKTPALFGIIGLGTVEAIEIGLGAIGIAQNIPLKDGALVMSSDEAQRILSDEARQKLGVKPRKQYLYDLLWVGEIKKGFADALFQIKWQGNEYGEIAGAHVVRNIHRTTAWNKSSLNISFKLVSQLPPHTIQDPRQWPIVFEYEGTFDPYGNGQFTFQGEFEFDAFGGLRFNKHEISDKSFASFLKMGKKEDYVVRYSNRASMVQPIPKDQLDYLKKIKGIK